MSALVAPDPPLLAPDGRFALRPWRTADAPALAMAWRDPDIARWCTVPDDASTAAAEQWIAEWAVRAERGLALDLVVADGVDDAVWGEVGLRRLARPPSQPGPEVFELGWWTAGPQRGSGIGAGAVTLLVGWARAAIDGQVVARIEPGHTASERIAAHAGLTQRGSLASGHALWAR